MWEGFLFCFSIAILAFPSWGRWQIKRFSRRFDGRGQDAFSRWRRWILCACARKNGRGHSEERKNKKPSPVGEGVGECRRKRTIEPKTNIKNGAISRLTAVFIGHCVLIFARNHVIVSVRNRVLVSA